MTWFHACGWSGTHSELKQFVYDGIVAGLECPQCGGEWPFFNDTSVEFDEAESWYTRCEVCGGSGERIYDFRDGGKVRILKCKACAGTGVVWK